MLVGKWTVEGVLKSQEAVQTESQLCCEIPARVLHNVSSALGKEDVLASAEGTAQAVNQGGTAGLKF